MINIRFYLAVLLLFQFLNIACSHKKNKSLEILSEEFKEIIEPDAVIEKLAHGFQFTEGPAWHPDGYLLFSDIPANTIYRWSPYDSVSIYLQPSGNSNGLAFDSQGILHLCQHGNRQLVKMIDDSMHVLASQYQDKQLNSPNDLVIANNGAIYFTDPPWGLPKNQNDPAKELDFNGVYKFQNDSLTLLIDSLAWPNGIALSPDEKLLYVGSFQNEAPRWYRYELNEEGLPVTGSLFFDAAEFGNNHPDGIAVDEDGNVYCTGPQGVLVLSPAGKLLGIIKPEELPANCTFGGADGKTLYMTAREGLYAVKLNAEGL